jgi:cell division protein ZapA (FtsZ GTPase activity inhibitor)
MEELKSMQVMIAGRLYPLRVKHQDVDAIKEVVEEINDKIKDFQLTYINKDKQDCLAMALLTYAVELQKIKQHNTAPQQISRKVEHLENLIENILK